MFNITFGLITCTLTFAEHIGHKFAAKYQYVYSQDFEKTIKSMIGNDDDGNDNDSNDDDWLTNEERKFRTKILILDRIKKIFSQDSLNYLDTHEYKQMNKEGFDKFIFKQLKSFLK